MAFDDFFEQPEGLNEYDENREGILENLNMLKGMSVEEHTFYKKWVEVQNYVQFANQSGVTKALIWKPTDILDKEQTLAELDALEPEIVFVDPTNTQLCMDWLMVRVFVHTMPFDQTPGRFLRFIVRDKVTGQYLGATSVASDVIVISDRDKYIGWTKETRLEGEKKLNYSAIGSCIMSTQPFGYNFLGSKLTAALVTSKSVRDVWENMYDCKMAGMTTTSLYGTKSFYNSVPQWRKCGASAGKISIKPDEKYYTFWHDYVKNEYADEYTKKMTQKVGVSGPVTGAKQRVIDMIFRHLKIKASNYTHGYMRGVYYSCFYDNTREFLRGEIKEEDLKMKQRVVEDVDGIINWWRPKARARYVKLLEAGNLKPDVTYYNKMINEDYQTSKDMFFAEVGR
jgi:hypothetical protein